MKTARFLLKPGRKYEDAVKAFQPYDRTQEVNEEARKAGAGMIVEGERYEPRRKTYIYVNNRLEGNALETISAMLKYSVDDSLLTTSQAPVASKDNTTTSTKL